MEWNDINNKVRLEKFSYFIRQNEVVLRRKPCDTEQSVSFGHDGVLPHTFW